MTDAEKLIRIIKQKNMTIKGLARKAGICPTTLYSIVNRNSRIKQDFAYKIGQALDIDPVEVCSSYSEALIIPQVGTREGCRFCLLKRKDLVFADPVYKEDADLGLLGVLTAEIKLIPQNSMLAFSYYLKTEGDYREVPINYCPMCGRKLGVQYYQEEG